MHTFMQRMSLFLSIQFSSHVFKQCYVRRCVVYVIWWKATFLQNQNTTHLNKQALFSVSKQCNNVQFGKSKM